MPTIERQLKNKTRNTPKSKEPLFDVDKEMKWYSSSNMLSEKKVYIPEIHLKLTSIGKHRSLSLTN